jgi:hypothetical protein
VPQEIFEAGLRFGKKINNLSGKTKEITPEKISGGLLQKQKSLPGE